MPYLVQLDRLCRHLTWQRAMVGVCWVIVTMILVASVLILGDFILDFHWVALRLLATATLLVSGVWAIVHFLTGLPKILPLHVALQLERFYPELGDRLASAVQFSQLEEIENRGDQLLIVAHGSAALRRAVKLRVAKEVEEVNWDLLLPKQQLRRTLLVLGLAVLLVASVAVLVPQTMRIGMARLFHPLGQDQWPRRVVLQLVDPPQLVVANEKFEVRVRNLRGPLPADVCIHYRRVRSSNLQAAHRSHEIKKPMVRTNQSMMVSRLVTTFPLEFRVTGDDDRDMPWHAVRVVARPQINSLQIRVQPPGYTGCEATTLVPLHNNRADRNASHRILDGSRLEVAGKASLPLTGIRLLRLLPVYPRRELSLKKQEMSTWKKKKPIERQEFSVKGHIGDDGQSFRIGSLQDASHVWGTHESGKYRLELTTQDGWVTCTQHSLSLEVVVDMPPHVEWLEPVDDQMVVPEAQVKLILRATDDYGLSKVSMTCQLDETSQVQEQDFQVLFPQSNHVSTMQKQKTVLEIPTILDLAGRGYQPGQTLLVRGQAADFFTHAGKLASQIGKTVRSLRLHVISQAAWLSDVQQRQALLVKQLTTALETQQNVHDRLLAESLRYVETRSDSDIAELRVWQRQVAQWLDRPDKLRHRQGAVQSVGELLRMLNQNPLVGLESGQRLFWLQSKLTDLARSELPDIETSLHYLRLSISSALAEDPNHSPDHRTPVPLSYNTRRADLLQKQEAVIGQLHHLLRELAHSNSLFGLTHQLQQLEHDQQQLIQRCRRYWQRRRGLASPTGADSSVFGSDQNPRSIPQQDVFWDQVIATEQKLALRTGQWISQLESAADRKTQSSPEAARRMTGVARAARRATIQATLKRAVDQLSQHRLDRALTIEQQALEQLQKLNAQLMADLHNSTNQESSPQLQQSVEHNFHLENRQTNDSARGDLAGSAPVSHASRAADPPSATQLLTASIGSLVDDLWGALPERERQQITQPVGVEFIPRYAPEIGAYFRALASPPSVGSPSKSQRSEP